MYTLKSIVRRGALLGAATALLGATMVPSAAVFADALNPLTERSLLLSSSAPGFMNTDGSGNSEDSPNANGDNWAPAGSGPNGQKTGETFTFNVSTDSEATTTPITAFSLQYCTTAAGLCQAPGNNPGDARDGSRGTNADGMTTDPKTSDLDVVMDEDGDGVGAAGFTQGTGDGQYQVYVGGVASTATWTMSVSNAEDDLYDNGSGVAQESALTGKNNYITLTSPTGVSPAFDETVKIVFNASSNSYITNPGAGAFFVKINTYKAFDDTTTPGTVILSESDILDGGVTVANVMTESIHITTKVLETMKFSVGTQNPDTQAVQHGSCDAIDVINGNRLELGNPSAESSLSTEQAYDVFSYWRLSSNSSGGATVYYSGETLKNTVGDEIAPIGMDLDTAPYGSKAHSQPGTEQFGLALIDAGQDTMDPGEMVVDTEDADNDGNTTEEIQARPFPSNWKTPAMDPLQIKAAYADGGYVDVDGTPTLLPISNETTAENAQFAFNSDSLTNPEVIAENSSEVISCATSKVRYVANIAADTPSGVYTTKINYLAAPQY